MKVCATREGHYPTKTHDGEDWKRRRAGDVFSLYERTINIVDIHTQRAVIDKKTGEVKTRLLTVEDQFSERWMERVPEETPEHTTPAHVALKTANEGLIAEKRVNAAAARG
jgi:hypothetical protein